MQRIAIVGLIKIELPGGSVNLCDGGYFPWAGDNYRGHDDTFGTISSVEPMTEGRGDEIPALQLTLLPPGGAAIADLSQPGFQKSRVRSWIAEYNQQTGQITGTPEAMFDGQIDQTTLRIGRERSLEISCVQTAERVFELDIGNSLSSAFHKSVWPGELGHDEATGLKTSIAWGVEAPARAGSSSGGAGGGFGSRFARVVNR